MYLEGFNPANFKPSRTRLLVQLETPKEIKDSKLVLPDEFKKKMTEDIRKPFGIVVSVGAEVKHYNIGDFVYFAKQSGREIESGNDFYLLLHEDEIYGKLSNEGVN